MSKIFIVRKKPFIALVTAAIILLGVIFYFKLDISEAVSGKDPQERVYHMVTGEFKTTTPDGEEIEAYRWDPGTIVVNEGDHVKLSIYGVNGMNHPFIIEGLNIQGEVNKGKETVVSFTADKKGIYRIICYKHPDIAHNGPMIGYIVVK